MEIIEGLPPDDRSSEVDRLERSIELDKFVVPKSLRQALNHGLGSDNAGVDHSDKNIRDLVSCELNALNHREKFQLLLYVEEVQMEVDIRKYDLADVVMCEYRDNRRLLTLNVPGLAENRPSVLRGDHLFVCRSKKKKKQKDEEGEMADTKQERCEFKGYVHQVQANQVCLGFSEKLMDFWIKDMKFNCRFVFNRLPLRLQHRAIILADEHSLHHDLLFPNPSTERQLLRDVVNDVKFYNRDIQTNTEQATAVRNIVAGTSRPAPFLVFGPPGTGKTITIIEAMKQVLKCMPMAHILACAPSNGAADLLARRLVKEPTPVTKGKLLRLYAACHKWEDVPEEVKECCNYSREKGRFIFKRKADLTGYSVIVSTLVTAGRLASASFPSGHFTHIFIDEAGQATEPETLIPIAGIFEMECTASNGGQVVLAGDPEQLGPVLRSPIAIRGGLGMSLLERFMKHIPVYMRRSSDVGGANDTCGMEGDRGGMAAYNGHFVVKLVRNYRSHPEILKVPNELFYDKELQPYADRMLRESLCQWSELPKKDFPILFHGVIGKDEREERSPSFFNADEASIVVKYVEELLKARGVRKVKQTDIGVISPYRKQVQKIQQVLKKLNLAEVAVESVEKFQGQERLVIIISTVRSNVDHIPIDHAFHLGFLRNPKRFNVAITRAKALLIVIGNPFVLAGDANWNRLLRFCIDHKAYIGCEFTEADLQDSDSAGIDDLLARLENVHLNEQSLEVDPRQIGHITEQLEPEWRVNM
jgi:helicase MOV-10